MNAHIFLCTYGRVFQHCVQDVRTRIGEFTPLPLSTGCNLTIDRLRKVAYSQEDMVGNQQIWTAIREALTCLELICIMSIGKGSDCPVDGGGASV